MPSQTEISGDYTIGNFESACESAIALAYAAKNYYRLMGQIGDNADALRVSHEKPFALLQHLLKGFLYMELFKLYDKTSYNGLQFSIPAILKMLEHNEFTNFYQEEAVMLMADIGYNDCAKIRRKLDACSSNIDKQTKLARWIAHSHHSHKETFQSIESVRNQIIAHPTLNPTIESFASYGLMGEYADWCILVIEGLMKTFFSIPFQLNFQYDLDSQKMALKRLIEHCSALNDESEQNYMGA